MSYANDPRRPPDRLSDSPTGEKDTAADLSTTEARQAVTLGSMRWVLALSCVAAIVAMVLVYIFVVHPHG